MLLEEIDGDDIIVRVRATPERADHRTRLEDEIIATLADVRGKHQIVSS